MTRSRLAAAALVVLVIALVVPLVAARYEPPESKDLVPHMVRTWRIPELLGRWWSPIEAHSMVPPEHLRTIRFLDPSLRAPGGDQSQTHAFEWVTVHADARVTWHGRDGMTVADSEWPGIVRLDPSGLRFMRTESAPGSTTPRLTGNGWFALENVTADQLGVRVRYVRPAGRPSTSHTWSRVVEPSTDDAPNLRLAADVAATEESS